MIVTQQDLAHLTDSQVKAIIAGLCERFGDDDHFDQLMVELAKALITALEERHRRLVETEIDYLTGGTGS